MNIFENRVIEVSRHYQNGDVSLGFRRMIDSALDTGKTEILKDIVAFTDWKYKQNPSLEEENKKAQELLIKIKNSGTSKNETSQKIIIEANQIYKSYSKGGFSIGPIDLNVHLGEVVGLVGENGNGKTTLLRCLSGELKLNSGNINYHFSKPYKNNYELRTRLVYIPQRIELLRGSLMDNLQFTLTTHGIKEEDNFYLAQVLLARMGLWPYKDLNWNRLSSGYKMRFELVRTLLRQPEILLLDEPLANLDIMAQQIILEDLRYLSGSLLRPFGVVLSSQQLYEVEKVSDKVIFLDHGHLVNDSSQKTEGEIEKNYMILEMDSTMGRDELEKYFTKSGLEKINFNGGNYVLYFSPEKSIQDVMGVISRENIPVTYIRDISNSSRRFFIN